MSNLLKRGTTVSSDERVIDYNDLVKSKLKHIIEIQNNKDNVDADGFVNGLKADVVEQLLTGSEDDMNEEAATDASYEAQAASIINSFSANCNNAGTYGIYASSGSTVNANNTTIQNQTTGSARIFIGAGSYVVAQGIISAGGTVPVFSQAVNTLTANGIIYQ